MVILRIDLAALTRGFRAADEVCEIDGVGTVSVATARAMMTDGLLAAVIADGADIRTVVHLGRQVTALQRTALIARDIECVVPGCHVRTGLEIDHVEDWRYTRVTRIDALARLCHHHHLQKTYGGWRLNGPPGQWRWHAPSIGNDDAQLPRGAFAGAGAKLQPGASRGPGPPPPRIDPRRQTRSRRPEEAADSSGRAPGGIDVRLFD